MSEKRSGGARGGSKSLKPLSQPKQADESLAKVASAALENAISNWCACQLEAGLGMRIG